MGASGPRYSIWIGDFCLLADGTYNLLLKSIMEFTIRAAIARSIDETEWEHDELCRHGLEALQIFRDGKAVWANQKSFESQLADAASHGDETFTQKNVADFELYERLERDLRTRWRSVGYDIPSLRHNMKKLFGELERDARDRARAARDDLLTDVLRPLFEVSGRASE